MAAKTDNRDNRRQRPGWVVIVTHVVTSAFIPPLVCFIAGVFAMDKLGIRGFNGFVTLMAILAIGYVGGTAYSMGHLRRTATTVSATRCIRPATTAFASLLVLQFAVIFLRPSAPRDTLSLAIAAPVYLFVIVAFWLITSRGMTAWEAESGGQR